MKRFDFDEFSDIGDGDNNNQMWTNSSSDMFQGNPDTDVETW